ncbi:MAG: hypothetical protein ACK5LK_08695, partial [Chthoniobacterales bacterium]
LTPGFIPELGSGQRKNVAQLLAYWKDNRRQAVVFALEEEYAPIEVDFAQKYWRQIQEKGTLDIDQKRDKKRIEKERELVYESTIENKEARELGTEWLCYQVIKNSAWKDSLPVKAGKKQS